MGRNAAGQPMCPGNYMLQGSVCVSINAGRPGGPDTVPLGRNSAGQLACPSNFNIQGNLCVSIHAKRAPTGNPAGVAGTQKGGFGDGFPPRGGNRDGYRDDRGYRRDDDRGQRRESYDDRDFRRGRDDYDRGPPRGRDDYDRGPPRGPAMVEPRLTPRGEWMCPPNYMIRGNMCVSAY